MGKRIRQDRVDQILDLYAKGTKYNEIAAICNCSWHAVRYTIVNNGGVLRKERRFSFNENFFETIDTEEKAYWLGFISADGAIFDDNTFKLQLAPKDKNHLQKLLNSLGSNHLIHESHSTLSNGKTYLGYQFTIKNSIFARDLIDKGVTPRKSSTLEHYIIPDYKLQRHYWRGFIDGDGCIQSRKSKNTICGYSLSLVGNSNITNAFKLWCEGYIETDRKLYPHPKSSVFYYLLSKKTDLIKLLKILYRDCEFFLDRKKEKAEEALYFFNNPFPKWSMI